MAERPFLSDLIAKRLAAIKNKPEHTRATRVLNDLASLLPVSHCVDETTKADVQKYVEKGAHHSIDRTGLCAQP